MQKGILYIGNKLAATGNNPTGVDVVARLLANHFRVIAASNKRNLFLRALDMMWHIVKYRNEVRFILIDTYSTLNFYYALMTAQFARLFKIPYIPILRGGNLPSRLDKSAGLSNMLFKNAFCLVSPSRYMQNEFKSRSYRSIYIPNSIRLSDYKFKERRVIRPKLLFVRSFHKIYNPTLAVELLYKLRMQYPQAKLCMVGPDKDGSKASCVNMAAKYGLIEHITFTGRLEKAQWHKLSEEYDIFINTTNFDNHPVSVIEAMALGIPVVSTDVGGLSLLISNGKTGFLVPPNSVDCFIKIIRELLENPKMVQSITENAKNLVSTFDWEVVKDQWIELLQKDVSPFN